MKILRFFLTLSVLSILSCSTTYKGPIYEGSPPIGTKYEQAGIPYGEGLHPGIDYNIPEGTPIVSVSDGIVLKITNPMLESNDPHGQGFFVVIQHGNYFYSLYGHLTKYFVRPDQSIKRGELIGLSGYTKGYPHLHFGIVKIGKHNEARFLSQTYNPDNFWLDGKPQCFDPKKDYSKYSTKEITLPVACGEYQRTLLKK